jgi:glutamine amidotransferase
MIVIVDYGMGNMRSVLHKVTKLNLDVVVSNDPVDIEKADKLILPGVGSFAAGMNNLKDFGLIQVLEKKVVDGKIPILGICLGMQLLTKHSEEGDADGLGWVDAETKRFSFPTGNGLRIPHVGWNTLTHVRDSHVLDGFDENMRFYFTHSYHVVCADDGDIVAQTNYGYDFTSILEKDNIVGVQFHPEKSHVKGMQLIKNFDKFY